MHMQCGYFCSLNIKVKEYDSAAAKLRNKMRNSAHIIVSFSLLIFGVTRQNENHFCVKIAISNGFRLKNSANIVHLLRTSEQ